MPVKRGDRSVQVRSIQNQLNRLGYTVKCDGSYGPETEQAVAKWKAAKGIKTLGNVLFDMELTLLNTDKPKIKSGEGLQIINMRYGDSTAYICCVDLKKYDVDIERGTVGKLETPTRIFRDLLLQGKKPLVGINLGFFGGTVEHLGTLMEEGKFLQTGDDRFMSFVLRKDGRAEVQLYGKDIPAAEIERLRQEAVFVVGSSYALLEDGKPSKRLQERFDHARIKAPRTLFGIAPGGKFYMVVVDGRTSVSKGLTAAESTGLMQSLGCTEAVNADGGGSSQMITTMPNLKVVNRPSDGAERAIGTMLIAYQKNT